MSPRQLGNRSSISFRLGEILSVSSQGHRPINSDAPSNIATP
ncbi:uncharacterized protein METZ01_LOCUS481412, partial [marine metagenome]